MASKTNMKPYSAFRLALVLAGIFALVGLQNAHPLNAAGNSQSTRERLEQLGGAPCPDSAFTCVTVTVPLDHFNPADPRTIDVVFAVLPATGTRKGMFVTATGGPGTAGIGCCADYYTSFFVRGLTEHFDIVFFDQRGAGLSGGLTCPDAAVSWALADWRADTNARAKKMRNAAQNFSASCDAESGASALLPFLGTNQAVQDLDVFRALMGDDKLWLYGESYGTQYAQTYANAHANHLAGMMLDGVVDLTMDGIPYYANATQAFNDTLVAALQACAKNTACARDFGMNPLRAYDKLAARLRSQKQPILFPLGTGPRAARSFGFSDLESTGMGSMYGQSGRMLFVRALAAYARDGDLVPLARLLYPNLGVDETTLHAVPDDTWSDVIFFGVECRDYGYFSTDTNTSWTNYYKGAKPVEDSGLRLASLIWGDLPCVYWRDAAHDITRPPHWSAPGVPTLVLNALADPITPINSARAVYEHLDDGYLITQRGGPHVIFGRGIACIDSIVNAFLLDDVVPSLRETECPGKVMDAYVPLAPRTAKEFSSPLQAMQSAETEIYYLPEYWYWDYATPTGVGCAYGGTVKFSAQGDLTKFVLQDCAFTDGFQMTGNGVYDYAADRFQLDVSVMGAQFCQLKYERVGEKATVKGKCAGAGVQLSGAQKAPVPDPVQNARPVRPARQIWRGRVP